MKKWIPIIIIVALLGLAVFVVIREGNKPGKFDSLAQCLKDKGATFYGAFWCPHCQKTKAMFGRSAKLLPYVECSTADGKKQLPICTDKGVESYPTWIFADGSRLTGERTMQELADKANCPLQ